MRKGGKCRRSMAGGRVRIIAGRWRGWRLSPWRMSRTCGPLRTGSAKRCSTGLLPICRAHGASTSLREPVPSDSRRSRGGRPGRCSSTAAGRWGIGSAANATGSTPSIRSPWSKRMPSNGSRRRPPPAPPPSMWCSSTPRTGSRCIARLRPGWRRVDGWLPPPGSGSRSCAAASRLTSRPAGPSSSRAGRGDVRYYLAARD